VLNNAGVAISGPIEFTPMAAIRHQLDVNLMGQIEVTQAMLAMIRKRRGRIVNVVSILGRIAVAFSAPYCMSKFAMEAFTDSLRLEMKAFGVHVSAIEPGVIKTPIWSKTRETTQEIIDELPPEGQQLYGGDLATFLETVQREGASGIPAGAVAEAVIHAFTAKVPRTRYLVGDDARQVARLRRLLGDRLLDRLLQWRYPTGQK
jgi:NAD(P)-dependent dehydrogenase (short-subunit alcohol dehydrogenase family)